MSSKRKASSNNSSRKASRRSNKNEEEEVDENPHADATPQEILEVLEMEEPRDDDDDKEARLNVVILDVRSPTEIQKDGFLRVVGANTGQGCRSQCFVQWFNVDVDADKDFKFLKRIASNIIHDCQTPVIVHCASGVRAAKAKKVLQRLNYQCVYNAGAFSCLQYLQDSLDGLDRLASPQEIVQFWNDHPQAELWDLLVGDEIDDDCALTVDTGNRLRKGISGWDEMESSMRGFLNRTKKNTPIIVVTKYGRRSQKAKNMIMKLGYGLDGILCAGGYNTLNSVLKEAEAAEAGGDGGGKKRRAAADDDKDNEEEKMEVEEDKEEQESNQNNNNNRKVFDGKVFVIVGKLSMKEEDFIALIEENGGVIKGKDANDVTHMVSVKGVIPKKAKDRGVESLREEKVMEMIKSAAADAAASGSGTGDNNNNNNKQQQGLDGKVFAITGSLSMKRADFVALIEENGGIVKGSVTKDVTHLISARDDTAKAKKAKESGVEIIKEKDVVALIENSSSTDDNKKEKQPNNNNKSKSSSSSPPLEDMIFAITGSLSMKRADFVSLIEENGGVVKGSVTKEVTHLVSARDDTAKAKKAKENGVHIIKEEELIALIESPNNKEEKLKNKTAAETPANNNGLILHLFEPCSSNELHDDHGEYTFEAEHHDGQPQPLLEGHHYSSMDTAPAKARKLAQQIHDALDGAEMHAGEAGYAKALVLVISGLGNVVDLDRIVDPTPAMKQICLDALGVREAAHELATLEKLDLDGKREVGFCNDDDHDDPDDNINRATAIMADSLQDAFLLDFDPDQVCCAPVIYGGRFEGCLVGVTGYRVTT